MQLAVWVAACCLLALSSRTRPAVSIITVVVLWFLVPAVGGSSLTGQASGPLSVHPATWLIFATFMVQLQRNPAAIWRTVARHPYAFLSLGLVIVGAVVTTAFRSDGGGMVLLEDQVVAPVLFFTVIVATAVESEALVDRLRTTLLLLGGTVSIIAFAQWASQDVLFYRRGFSTLYWFDSDGDRWMSVLDQPLALSMVLCVIAPLAAGVRASLQIPLLASMAGAVAISQSRTGLAVFFLVALYLVLSARIRSVSKIALITGLAAAGSFLMTTPLAEGVLGRIADDTGSSDARSRAITYFFANWTDSLFIGGGIGSSYGVAEQAGLETSLESSILMYAVDLGVIFALLYFGVMLAFFCFSAGRTGMRGLAVAGFLVLLIPQTYSALATRSAAGILVWTILAMLLATADRIGPRGDTPKAQGSRAFERAQF